MRGSPILGIPFNWHSPSGLSPRVRGSQRLHPMLRRALPARSIPACAGEPFSTEPVMLLDQVYPRVCGGACWSMLRRMHQTGLSPRVRGSRDSILEPEVAPGSIPACAGEPPSGKLIRKGSEVYPRVCGGAAEVRDFRYFRGRKVYPRVCGGACHLPVGVTPMVTGSIPACAGEP